MAPHLTGDRPRPGLGGCELRVVSTLELAALWAHGGHAVTATRVRSRAQAPHLGTTPGASSGLPTPGHGATFQMPVSFWPSNVWEPRWGRNLGLGILAVTRRHFLTTNSVCPSWKLTKE